MSDEYIKCKTHGTEYRKDSYCWGCNNPAEIMQEKLVQKLEQENKRLRDALLDYSHALSYATTQLSSCECDQSVNFTCANCCTERDYRKHIGMVEEIRKQFNLDEVK